MAKSGFVFEEYPRGKTRIERVLVKMLNDERCWADYEEIGMALINLRFHADQMNKERRLMDSFCGTDEVSKEG